MICGTNTSNDDVTLEIVKISFPVLKTGISTIPVSFTAMSPNALFVIGTLITGTPLNTPPPDKFIITLLLSGSLLLIFRFVLYQTPAWGVKIICTTIESLAAITPCVGDTENTLLSAHILLIDKLVAPTLIIAIDSVSVSPTVVRENSNPDCAIDIRGSRLDSTERVAALNAPVPN